MLERLTGISAECRNVLDCCQPIKLKQAFDSLESRTEMLKFVIIWHAVCSIEVGARGWLLADRSVRVILSGCGSLVNLGISMGNPCLPDKNKFKTFDVDFVRNVRGVIGETIELVVAVVFKMIFSYAFLFGVMNPKFGMSALSFECTIVAKIEDQMSRFSGEAAEFRQNMRRLNNSLDIIGRVQTACNLQNVEEPVLKGLVDQLKAAELEFSKMRPIGRDHGQLNASISYLYEMAINTVMALELLEIAEKINKDQQGPV